MSEVAEFRARSGDEVLAKKLNGLAWVVSAAVLGLVVMMQKIKIPLPDGVEFSYLPGFHALLNSAAAVFLLFALWAIKLGKVTVHRKMIYAAFACSFIFLLSYVVYHITSIHLLFEDIDYLQTSKKMQQTEINPTMILIATDNLNTSRRTSIVRTQVYCTA